MASLRKLKKDIDYLTQEVLSDCYLTMYFHPEKKEELVGIMREAADLRNGLYERVNNPVEKNNKHLVRKHYMQVRLDMMHGVDELFTKLSGVSK